MEKVNKCKLEKYLPVFLCFILLVISSANIHNLHQIFVLQDEFGYWATAAKFAGKDWTGIIANCPYYSYGYSFLLAPLVAFIKNDEIRYQCAIGINVLLYLGAYMLSRGCMRELKMNISRVNQELICFIVALYGNTLFQINIAWTETLLYFLFWLFAYLFLKYIKKHQTKYAVIAVLVLAYMYIVHQRAIGAVVCGGLLLLVEILKSKDDLSKQKMKSVIKILVAGVVIFVIAYLMKKNLKEYLWIGQNAEVAGRNEYSGQISKLASLFSLSGIKALIYSLTGKIVYLLISTCGLITLAFYEPIKEIFHKELTVKTRFAIMSALCILAEVGVSAIFWMNNNRRIDGLIYGRYAEAFIGPILMLGLILLFEKKYDVKMLVINIGLLLAGGVLVQHKLNGMQEPAYVEIMAIITTPFIRLCKETYVIWYAVGLALIVAVGYCVATYSKVKWFKYCVPVVMVAFWLSGSTYTIENKLNLCQGYIEDVHLVADAVESINDEAPIYYVNDSAEGQLLYRIEHIQYLLEDRTIHLITANDLDEKTNEDCFIIAYRDDTIDYDEYNYVTQGYDMMLFVPSEKSISEKAEEYRKDNLYMVDDTMMTSATSDKPGKIESDNKEGFLMYLQNLTIPEGRYVVHMELEVEDAKADMIGTADVSYNYGEGVLCSQDVYREDDNNINIEMKFDCTELQKNVELRFYALGNAKVRLRKLYYEVIE